MRTTGTELAGALALAALAAGCAQGPQLPSQGAPRIAGIYGVNLAPQVQTRGVPGNALPDFQLYALPDPSSGDPHAQNPPTAPLAPAYQALRIDFDQPMDGATLAQAPTLAGAVAGPQSFCSQLPTPTVQLLDGAGAPVPSSVCYESGSAFGQGAHVYVTPGAGTLTSPPANPSPFTCNAFSSATDSGDEFQSGKSYSLRLDAPSIKSSAGQPLQLPSGSAATGAAAGWSFSANAFAFKTSGFDVMAVGYRSLTTGTDYFNAKPAAAFEPFRDPIPDAAGVACKPGDDPSKPCRLGADATPYLVFLTRPVRPGSVTRASVALTRSSGAPAEYGLAVGASLLQDAATGATAPTPGNVIQLIPGTTWEPGEVYTLTLAPGGLTADDGTPLTGPNAKSYVFSVLAPPPAPPSVRPQAGTANVPFAGASSTLTYAAPVAVDLLGNPVGTFSLQQGGSAVPSTAAVGPAQVVTISPTSVLAPETTYTVSASGVRIAAFAKNAGAAQPDLPPSPFTTASLQVAGVFDPGAGSAIAGSASVDPAELYSGNMTVFFNDQVTNVGPATVVLSEAGGPALAGEQVAMGLDASQWTVAVPPSSEPFKFRQRYQLHLDRTIASASATGAGHTLKVFPCAASADCSDNRFFTTQAYAPSLGRTLDASGNLTRFTVSFPYPATAASLDLANSFYIFALRADGSVDLSSRIRPSCTGMPAAAPTTITCTPPAGTTFARATTYQFGATFGGPVPAGPAVPAAAAASPVSVTTSTGATVQVPVDPANSTFTGSVAGTFTTGC